MRRALAGLGVLALVSTLAVRSSTALAAASFSLQPTCGSVGASVAATGSGWTPGYDVTITFDPNGLPPYSVIVRGSSLGPNGDFGTTLTVPSRPNRGTPYAVQAVQRPPAGTGQPITVTASFYVPCPGIVLEPPCGPAGLPIVIRGAGWRPGITVGLALVPPATGKPDATALPAQDSTFAINFTVPQRPPGTYEVVATQTPPAGIAALPPIVVRTQFQIPCVKAAIKLAPDVGPPGTVTTVTGTGFPLGAVVKLTWSQGIPLSIPSITIPATQGFQTTILIFPHDQLGQRTLSAAPDLSVTGAPLFNIATAVFLVGPGSEQPRDFSWRH